MNLRRVIKEELDFDWIGDVSFTNGLRVGRNSIFMPQTIEEKYSLLRQMLEEGYVSENYFTSKDPDTGEVSRTKEGIRFIDWFHDKDRRKWLERVNNIYVIYPNKVIIGYDAFKSKSEIIKHYKTTTKGGGYSTMWDDYGDEIMSTNYINWDGSDSNESGLTESQDFNWIEDIDPSDVEREVKLHLVSHDSMYLLYFYPAITKQQCNEEVLPILYDIFPNYEFNVSDNNIDHLEIDVKRPFAIAADVQYFGDCSTEECYVNELYGSYIADFTPINGRHIFNIKEVMTESDDFQWIQDSKPTLIQIFNAGDLKEGDIVTIQGEIMDDSDEPTSLVTMEIKISYLGEKLRTTQFDLMNPEDRRMLHTTETVNLSFIDADEDLEVVKHDKSGRGVNESDDFDWIEDTEQFTLPKKWIIKNDIDEADDDGYLTGKDIQNWLFDNGYKWDLEEGHEYDILYEDNLYFFSDNYYSSKEGYFDAYSGWNNNLSEMIDRLGYEVYDWSDVRNSI